MSLNNIPSKVEVMGWNPQSLADYMKRLKLSGCDKVVMKGRVTGAQFMQLTEGDLQVFPSIYIPIITKIQSDINKGEKKITFVHKSNAQMFPKRVFVEEEQEWNSDEFDGDCDYEGLQEEEEEDDYVCAMNEPQTAEQDGDVNYEEEPGQPSSADTMVSPGHSRVTTLQDYRYEAPARQPNLYTERSNKPGQHGTSQKGRTKSKGSTIKASNVSQPQAPKPKVKSNRDSKHIPAQPAMVNTSMPRRRGGLDPSWYRGNMTRHQAEVVLREVNKDGTFLVRDSSKGSDKHHYTLMLLHQGKIYNIKIRNERNSCSLGTGRNNTKSFPGVKEMITHHTHTPLLLIDATDQTNETLSQCCLLHPAGP